MDVPAPIPPLAVFDGVIRHAPADYSVLRLSAVELETPEEGKIFLERYHYKVVLAAAVAAFITKAEKGEAYIAAV
jgi:hypothetical protein